MEIRQERGIFDGKINDGDNMVIIRIRSQRDAGSEGIFVLLLVLVIVIEFHTRSRRLAGNERIRLRFYSPD